MNTPSSRPVPRAVRGVLILATGLLLLALALWGWRVLTEVA